MQHKENIHLFTQLYCQIL